MRCHRLHLLWLLLFVVTAACNSCSSPTTSANHPNPPAPLEQHSSSIEALPADAREPALAVGLRRMLESEHLVHRSIDDEVSRAAFDEYVDRLDPGKLFLLEEHVAVLEEYRDRIDDELRAGDFELARVGASLLAERQAVVSASVASILARPFDFERDETIETDGEKLDFVATEAELAERWRKVLKLQALERIARMDETAEALAKSGEEGSAVGEDDGEAPETGIEDIPETAEGREKKARSDLAKSYAGRFSRLAKLEPLEPAETFLNAITAVFDPHTLYLAPADKENFDIQMSGSLEGIGAALIEDDHYIEIQEIIPGGASWRQGKLEPGDLILAVAQKGEEPVDIADMRLNQVVQMIRGPKGTVVTLTVKKPDNRIEVISITRDVVEIEAAYARGAILDLGARHPEVGYLYLPSFYGNTRSNAAGRNAADDIRTLLGRFQKSEIDSVIIDLRGNGGGLLEHARDITGMLIETGPVVQTRYPDDKIEVLSDEDPSIAYTGKVVVLVDRFSASASEIVAGALQDYSRALIVGTGHTHGKGTVQMLVDLNRLRREPGEPLGVLKLTIQQFFRVDGDSTQWRGVVPDIVLPDPVAHIESGERFLDNSIPWSEVDALPFDVWPKKTWDTGVLAKKSAARREEHAAFAKIDARAAYLEERREDTTVPLARAAWEARRERDEKALEKVDPELEEGPARFSVQLIDYDGATPNGGSARLEKAAKERIEAWKKTLSRDPWVEEALYLVADMGAGS